MASRSLIAVALTFLLVSAAAAQSGRPRGRRKGPKVDQERVDKAIDRGCAFLLKQADTVLERTIKFTWEPTSPGSHRHSMLPLVVLTLKHGGISEDNPTFEKLLAALLDAKIDTTYMAAVQAMALQKIDPVKHQHRIAECAQFLIDNQARNGQWCYSHPTEIVVPEPKIERERAKRGGIIRTGRGKGKREKPKKVRRYYLKRRNAKVCKQGDNSNSQYAALGLRAAMECNVVVPQETLRQALQYWERAQRPDGGWTYGQPDMLDGKRVNDPFSVKESYGSMTVGGMTSIAIYKYLLGGDPSREPRVRAAEVWLDRNWSVANNPGNPKYYHFYYLYGVERVGDLLADEKLGSHHWYVEGAKWLLDDQGSDGSWKSSNREPEEIAAISTCFAVLFLKRATEKIPTIKTKSSRRK